jgi:hypothetical protein
MGVKPNTLQICANYCWKKLKEGERQKEGKLKMYDIQ